MEKKSEWDIAESIYTHLHNQIMPEFVKSIKAIVADDENRAKISVHVLLLISASFMAKVLSATREDTHQELIDSIIDIVKNRHIKRDE